LRIFLFRAEDGIRDFHVTGVQTCALPISLEAEGMPISYADDVDSVPAAFNSASDETLIIFTPAITKDLKLKAFFVDNGHELFKQIGRASCRERVAIRSVSTA